MHAILSISMQRSDRSVTLVANQSDTAGLFDAERRHAYIVCSSELPVRGRGNCRHVAARLGRYLSGPLKRAGFTDITFIDAMTEEIDDDELACRMAELNPDVVDTMSIRPSIYAAERVL